MNNIKLNMHPGWTDLNGCTFHKGKIIFLNCRLSDDRLEDIQHDRSQIKPCFNFSELKLEV